MRWAIVLYLQRHVGEWVVWIILVRWLLEIDYVRIDLYNGTHVWLFMCGPKVIDYTLITEGDITKWISLIILFQLKDNHYPSRKSLFLYKKDTYFWKGTKRVDLVGVEIYTRLLPSKRYLCLWLKGEKREKGIGNYGISLVISQSWGVNIWWSIFSSLRVVYLIQSGAWSDCAFSSRFFFNQNFRSD